MAVNFSRNASFAEAFFRPYTGALMMLCTVASSFFIALGSSKAIAFDVISSFACCEAETYKVIGNQTNIKATLGYLEKKYELVRVCIVRQRFKFNTENFHAHNVEVAETMRALDAKKQALTKAGGEADEK